MYGTLPSLHSDGKRKTINTNGYEDSMHFLKKDTQVCKTSKQKPKSEPFYHLSIPVGATSGVIANRTNNYGIHTLHIKIPPCNLKQ
jgi:hypothetical protein